MLRPKRAPPRTRELATLQAVLAATPQAPGDLEQRLHAVQQALYELEEELRGHQTRAEIGDYDVHRIGNWLRHASAGVANSTYGPTPAHRRSLDYAAEAFAPVAARLNAILTGELPKLRAALRKAGAPWAEGQIIPPN